MQITNLANFATVALFAGLLVVLVLAPRKLIHAQALTLLRSFFPAWRFFEAIGPSPTLSYRVIGTEQPGPWTDALLRETRGLSSLLLNARGNLALACQSLVEQFDSDLEATAPGEVTQLVSYQLINNLVVARIRASAAATTPGSRYEFRVVLPHNGEEAQAVSFSSGTLAL